MLDRLLANKPHERYQTAQEAAEALAGLRPRRAPREEAPSRKAAAEPAPAPAPAPQPLPPPPPEYIEVHPEYPFWFRPLAELAERSSPGAFALFLLLGFALFGLGFLTALIVRS